MTRRTTAVGLALLLLAPTAAACDSAATTNGSANAASATSAADTKPSCTPVYTDTQDTGITLAGGTVTATVTLTCTLVPAPGQIFSVTIGLNYLSSGNAADALCGDHSIDGYQDKYTATAPCKPGAWSIGYVVDGATITNSDAKTVTITDCTQTID